MNSITVISHGGLLRQIVTDIEILVPSRPNIPSSVSFAVKAIWDTGATGSCITTNVVKKLGLIPTGMTIMSTANGNVNSNTFTIDIRLPGNVVVQGITASEVTSLTSGCDALIGMDIITLGDFSITNHKGVTCMSFRIPSSHQIDYVKNPNYGLTPIRNIPAGKLGSKFTPPKKKRKKR